MAEIVKNQSNMDFPLQIARQYAAPLDKYEVFYSLLEAQAYATKPATDGGRAYVGQVIAVVNEVFGEDGTTLDPSKTTVDVYKINADGSLGEIGGVVSTDNQTITYDAEKEVLKLVGFGEKYDDNKDFEAGLQLTTVVDPNGGFKLAWIKPDTTTVEGLTTTVESLKTQVTGIENNLVPATQSKAGFMSAEDKTKLDGLPDVLTSSDAQNKVKIETDGTLTVNSLSGDRVTGKVSTAGTADQTKESLKVLGSDGSVAATFNGSSEVSISAETLGALTELEIASENILGGVKVGSDLAIDTDGKLSVDRNSLKATSTDAGIVKPDGTTITITDGTISAKQYSLPTASTTVKGGVKVDNSTIVMEGEVAKVGTISAEQVNGTVASATEADSATNYKKSTGGTESIDTALGTKLNSADLKTEIFKADNAIIGGTNGLVQLSNGLIESTYLPSYVDDIIEGVYVNETTFNVDGVAITPEAGKIYVDTANNYEYRWSGSKFICITDPLDYATTSDATAMTDTTKVMTAARTSEAIQASSINVAKLIISDGDTLILNCGSSVV